MGWVRRKYRWVLPGVLVALMAGGLLLLFGKGTGKEPESGQQGTMPGESVEEENTRALRESRVEARVREEGKRIPEGEEAPCIVIDPGHGGFDPGKVGINGAKEKDVNLEIAGLVRDYLAAAGVRVVMTREEDRDLCQEGENKKVQDLKNRIARMEEAAPRAAVSIHQNSYPEEYVHGSQVFYYKTSVEGRYLAEKLQARLIAHVDPENTRQVKANDSYFLLKKTSIPLVIAECGFLSNSREAEKLCTPEYQDAVAWAIYLGIMDYLEETGEEQPPSDENQ